MACQTRETNLSRPGPGLLGRPVSDKLGPGLTSLASRRVAGWAGPEPSLRHVRQAWPPKVPKKQFCNCQHIFDKNGPMELDADEPRKFQGPPDRILGPAGMGGGGGPAKFWLGRGGVGEGKSQNSLWRRDLSALGPFGAEANFAAARLRSVLDFESFAGRGHFLDGRVLGPQPPLKLANIAPRLTLVAAILQQKCTPSR